MSDEAIRRYLEALFELTGTSGRYAKEAQVGSKAFGDEAAVESAQAVGEEAHKRGLVLRASNGEVMMQQDGLMVIGKG